MKALVGAFNQEKVGAFSVVMKTDCETDGSFYSITYFGFMGTLAGWEAHHTAVIIAITKNPNDFGGWMDRSC